MVDVDDPFFELFDRLEMWDDGDRGLRYRISGFLDFKGTGDSDQDVVEC